MALNREPALVPRTRRELLKAGPALPPLFLMAAVGRQAVAASQTGVSTAGQTAACVLSPEQTEGPYYIDEGLLRSDITEGKPGIPLQLNLSVREASTCQPISKAMVEIWHCDAGGVYSGYDAAQVGGGAPPGAGGGLPPTGSQGPPAGAAGGGGHQTPTNTLTFLRGGQVTDATGGVVFQTVYPGWYMGRTTHIHVMVHVSGQTVHTGQLYIDDSINDAVYAQDPYAAHPNRDTTNATDSIFASGGPDSLLALTPVDNGYVGAMALAVSV